MTELLRLTEVCCDLGRGRQRRRILNQLNLSLAQGECLGVVGESGSGKTTLGRILVGLQGISAGTVSLRGKPLERLRLRGKLQMVFQDSARSLNPRRTIADNLVEPLSLQGRGAAERERAARFWIERVGLRQDHLSQLPGQLSGGQKQRVCIARAFIAEPELVVCDEAISALDVSVQAQILHLLRQLQQETGVTMVFIAHDLPIVRALTQRMLVMYGGEILEMGEGERIFRHPAHPYTASLIAATPGLDPSQRHLGGAELGRAYLGRDRQGLQATVLNPAASGCVYRLRCDRANEQCLQAPTQQTLTADEASPHTVSCWHPLQ